MTDCGNEKLKPYFSAEAVKLYQGDVITLANQLPAECVDLIFRRPALQPIKRWIYLPCGETRQRQ